MTYKEETLMRLASARNGDIYDIKSGTYMALMCLCNSGKPAKHCCYGEPAEGYN